MADIQSLIWCVLKHTSRQHGWFFLCQEFSVASFLYLPHRRLQSSPVSSYWDFLALQLYLFTLHFHRTAYWLWSARFPLSCSDPGLSEHVRLGDGGMPECLSPTASLSEGFDGMFLSLALFALAFFIICICICLGKRQITPHSNLFLPPSVVPPLPVCRGQC